MYALFYSVHFGRRKLKVYKPQIRVNHGNIFDSLAENIYKEIYPQDERISHATGLKK